MKRVSGKQQRKQFNGCSKTKDDHPTAIWNAICCGILTQVDHFRQKNILFINNNFPGKCSQNASVMGLNE